MATAELVMLTPLAIVVLGFLVAAGRLATVQSDVASTSRDAARAASMAQTYASAQDAARFVAAENLTGHDVTCRDLDVTLGDSSSFRPGGHVEVTIRCTVVLSDVAVPGLPGTRDVAATSVEVIDQFRSVG